MAGGYRLNRRKAWGLWYVTTDGGALIYDHRDSGFYDVSLRELFALEDAVLRVEKVIAVKRAWVTQRVVDDLRRALRDVKGFDVPRVDIFSR